MNSSKNAHQQGPHDESESQTVYGEGGQFEDEPHQYHHDPGSNYDQQPYPQPREGQYEQGPYDASESQTAYGEGEQFEDEPQQRQHDPGSNYDQQPYPQPREGQYDDLRYDNGEPFQDHVPYAQQQYQQPHPSDGGKRDDPNSIQAEQEQAPAPEPRKHKYSTANVQETGKWKKWCSILLLFALFLAVMIGLSMLFNHFFFGDVSDNGPQTDLRPENTTFPKDKQEVDTACSSGSFTLDQGDLCQEACAPQFFKCCDPFDEFKLYNYSESETPTAVDENKTSSSRYDIPDEKNTTFLDGYAEDEYANCTFDVELRGCMSYAKCQTLGGQADPAPANLPDICSIERLAKDDEGCKELCRKFDCCYSSGSDNCLADNFDLCMDYAPCQNLRSLDDPNGILETAPRTLDYDCHWQLPSCTDDCEAARCCSDPENSCFQNNFMSCLTYSPCTETTEIKVTLTPQFSHVNKPPSEIVYACNAHKEAVLEPSTKNCEQYCTDAICCWDSDPSKNCFQLDPLGCLAWIAQCQVLQQ